MDSCHLEKTNVSKRTAIRVFPPGKLYTRKHPPQKNKNTKTKKQKTKKQTKKEKVGVG